MPAPYRHKLCVEVVSDMDRGQRQMQERLHRWLETYGHTASSYGFEFKSVDVFTGKHVFTKKPKGNLR